MGKADGETQHGSGWSGGDGEPQCGSGWSGVIVNCSVGVGRGDGEPQRLSCSAAKVTFHLTMSSTKAHIGHA